MSTGKIPPGVTGGGTEARAERVTLANDSTGQVQLATGSAVIGALTANQSENLVQLNGTAITQGNGITGVGTQRVTISNDSTGVLDVTDRAARDLGSVDIADALPTGSNVIGALSANQSVNLAQVSGAAVPVGGGVQATAQRVTIASDSTGQIQLATGSATIGALTANQSVNVAQMNAVTVSMDNGAAGTGVQRVTIASDSTGKVEVVGDVAHDAAVAGNPVLVAGRANQNEPAVVADVDSSYLWVDQHGRVVTVKNFPSNVAADSTHGPRSVTLTSMADAAVVAAPGASLSIYVTSLACSNTSATKSRVDIKDGTTTRLSMMLAADGGGFVLPYDPPWKITANTALNGAQGTTVTDIRVNVHYYVSA